MKNFLKLKHPKLVLLVLVIIFAYFIFSKPYVQEPLKNLGETSNYLATFVGGILFTFGFTTPIAIGIFLTLEPSNLLVAAIIGGLGAVLSDLVILRIIRKTYHAEFNDLKHASLIKRVRNLLHNKMSARFKHYLLYVVAGLVIALPIPDEIGVSMLAGFTHIKQTAFIILSFILHSIGILLFLWIAMIP